MSNSSPEGSRRPVRVLVIDDSALVRSLLSEILGADPQIQVVGTAPDPFAARDLIKRLDPDVLTLDVEMPRMDGITFLRNLMRLRPMPVVMISSLTEAGADVTLEALSLGAVDFVAKPAMDVAAGLESYASEVVAKVKAAARAKVRARTPGEVAPRPRVSAGLGFGTTDKVVAIGASTGGTEAVREVLAMLPPDLPGVVIVQHIPALFSRSFAQRLDRETPLKVTEAEDGAPIRRGHAYVAPGDHHLRVVASGAHYFCKIVDLPPVNRHRPSVDVLFDSMAEQVASNGVGVLLTGMGRDGASGLAAMRNAGAHTVAQDERSSVVWGMPGAAVKLGAASEVVPLDVVPERIVQALSRQAVRA